jgi:hypothetical protein
MKNLFSTIFMVLLSVQLSAQISNKTEPIEILIIGTYHFTANSGAIKTDKIDINSISAQKELDNLSTQIAAYKPDQFFVEWEASEQNKLNEHYLSYLNGDYESYLEQMEPKLKKFYLDNEFAQIAFRTGKKLKLPKMEGIDFQTGFAYDSVIKTAEKFNQQNLLHHTDEILLESKNSMNNLMKTKSIIKVLKEINTEKFYELDKRTYLEGVNQIGDENNFTGAYLVSELYRRNLYMISLLQKKMNTKTKRVAVLVGSSHAGFFTEMLKYDKRYKVINLNEVVK